MKTIVIVSQDIVTASLADKLLSPLYRTVVFRSMTSALDYIYSTIPNLVVVDLHAGDETTTAIININLKEDPMFSQLPILAILTEPDMMNRLDQLFVEDFIWRGDLEKELTTRVSLSLLRSERNVEISPLTRLPGNISINRQIEERLSRGDIFSFAYADLDHFKPLNDKYGFSRGDEVIKITGRLILNFVKNKQPQNSFIGHIGGDDFIFIMDIGLVEETAQEIINAFDSLILTFYDQEDRERGHIESADRQGVVRTFPIVGISIGITDTKTRQCSHYGELTEIASEMKKYAKQIKGSVYTVDKRSNHVKDP